VRPVLEKIATIVARHLAGHDVDTIYLVGGTSAFPGIAEVVTEVTGIRAVVPTATAARHPARGRAARRWRDGPATLDALEVRHG
jgi:Ethanolamine utilization protein EutJ (predicted chaperonin)